MKVLAAIGALVLSLAVSNVSLAHHSYVAEFDADNPTTIEGIVKEVWNQLALRTPGSSPLRAISRKQMRQSPKYLI